MENQKKSSMLAGIGIAGGIILLIIVVVIAGLFFIGRQGFKDEPYSSIDSPIKKGGKLKISGVEVEIKEYSESGVITSSKNDDKICHTADSNRSYFKLKLHISNTTDKAIDIKNATLFHGSDKAYKQLSVNESCVQLTDSSDQGKVYSGDFQVEKEQEVVLFFEITKNAFNFDLRLNIDGKDGYIEVDY